MTKRRSAVAALACVMLSGCTWFEPIRLDPRQEPAPAPAPSVKSAAGGGGPKKAATPVSDNPGPYVIFIAVDGLRPDAINPRRTPTISNLIAKGAWAGDARNILPCKTIPNHAAMVTGLDADGHGLKTNYLLRRDALEVPTVFDISRDAGKRTAFYFYKDKLGVFDRERAGDLIGRGDGIEITSRFARDFPQFRYNLTMLCLPDPDQAGHAHGWMGPTYMDAVRRVDNCVAMVLAAVDAAELTGKVHIVLTADHGGIALGHSDDRPENRTIPFLVYGPTVRAGSKLGSPEKPTSVMDAAPTIAHMLGLKMPDTIKGRVLAEAFVNAPVAAAPAEKEPAPAEAK